MGSPPLELDDCPPVEPVFEQEGTRVPENPLPDACSPQGAKEGGWTNIGRVEGERVGRH